MAAVINSIKSTVLELKNHAKEVFPSGSTHRHIPTSLDDYGMYTSDQAWIDFPSSDRAEDKRSFSDTGINMDVSFQTLRKGKTRVAPFIFPKHHSEHAVLRTSRDGYAYALQRGALVFGKGESISELVVNMNAYELMHKQGFDPWFSRQCDAYLLVTLTSAGEEKGSTLVPCGGGEQTIRVFAGESGKAYTIEVQPEGLQGAARLHGNLHVEDATDRCDLVLLVRPVWKPRLGGDVVTSISEAKQTQDLLALKVATARHVLHHLCGEVAIKTPIKDSATLSAISGVAAGDVSASRKKTAQALLSQLDAQASLSELSDDRPGTYYLHYATKHLHYTTY